MRAPHFSLLLLLSSLPALSQSFSCTHAATVREQTICSTAELRKLEAQLASEFERVHGGVPAAFAADVLAGEQEWLRSSDAACKETARGASTLADCLSGEYESRLDELQQQFDLGDNHWLVFLHHRAGSYPQIEPWTPEQAEWNRAARAVIATRKAKAASGLKRCRKEGADLPKRIRDDMKANVDWRLAAANTHLITLRFTYFENCGGAHPSTSFEDWNWLLDKGKLNAPDVFRAGSSWQQPVLTMAKERLRALEYFSNYSSGDMIKGADTIGLDTKQWQPTREGLRLQFQQYQVAAYVFGMPSVTIPWSDLKPYLNPAWHPEQLPKRVPGPDDR